MRKILEWLSVDFLRRKQFTLLILILGSSLLIACETADRNKVGEDLKLVGTKIGSGAKIVGKKVQGGVTTGLKNFNSGSTTTNRSNQTKNEDAVVSKFSSNEIPHTLMKKPVATGTLTSGHGYRLSPTGLPLPRKHKGVDYGAPTGTPIYAAGSGVIDKLYVSKSFGKYISIQHENDFRTVYAHMDSFGGGLEVGSKVSRGQTIGLVGSTGRSSGPHLHYELLYKGRSIDPLFE